MATWTPTEPTWCARCGARVERYHQGRGREIGEHPDHRYAEPCGHDLDWFGERREARSP